MSWEYRVVRHRINGQEHLSIKEVYYDKNENIIAVGDASVPYGEDVAEVKEVLNLMLKAIEKEHLDMPLFKDTKVYCTNCINVLDLIKSIESETPTPKDCTECSPYNFKNGMKFKDRPKYKLK